MWIPEEEKKECGVEKEFKDIMAENFPDLVKNTNLQIQEAEKKMS